MQRRKKQLLGLVGLALVAAVTAIAFTIPAPEASAADDPWTQGVNLTVRVEENIPQNHPWSSIISPLDGSSNVNQNLRIGFSYKNANNAVVKLIRLTADGQQEAVTEITPTCEMTYSSTTQSCEFDYDLGAFPFEDEVKENAGVTYRLQVTPRYGSDKGVEDSVQFFYRAAKVEFNNKLDEASKNPVLDVFLNNAINYALVQVYDADGRPVFIKNGNVDEQTPLKITAEQILNSNGQLELLLPLGDYGAKAGKYRAVLLGYSAEGKLLAIATAPNIEYDGGAKPTVPDTGNVFRDLNISRADYLIVGLMAFGLVAGFAVFLIVRRNRR